MKKIFLMLSFVTIINSTATTASINDIAKSNLFKGSWLMAGAIPSGILSLWITNEIGKLAVHIANYEEKPDKPDPFDPFLVGLAITGIPIAVASGIISYMFTVAASDTFKSSLITTAAGTIALSAACIALMKKQRKR